MDGFAWPCPSTNCSCSTDKVGNWRSRISERVGITIAESGQPEELGGAREGSRPRAYAYLRSAPSTWARVLFGVVNNERLDHLGHSHLASLGGDASFAALGGGELPDHARRRPNCLVELAQEGVRVGARTVGNPRQSHGGGALVASSPNLSSLTRPEKGAAHP